MMLYIVPMAISGQVVSLASGLSVTARDWYREVVENFFIITEVPTPQHFNYKIVTDQARE